MEKKKLGLGWAATAVSVMILGGGFYLMQTDGEEIKENKKEAYGTTSGFSGTSKNGNSVAITHGSFTGSQKAIINPEKQEVVKEGFSGQKTPVVETKGGFTGGGFLVPKKNGDAKPTLFPKKEEGQVDAVIAPKPSEQAIPTVHPTASKEATPTIDTNLAIDMILNDITAAIETLKKAQEKIEALRNK